MDVTAIVPAHNEGANIEATIKALKQQVRKVIVACDHCTDDTYQKSIQAGAVAFETVDNQHRKAGALNQALENYVDWQLPDQYIFICDAETVIADDWIERAQIVIDNNNRLSTKKLAELGHRLNASNPWFPKGVNVSFGRVIGQNQLFVQTYEWGVGFTNACGTGMSATSLVWSLLNDGQTRLDEVNDIFNPGGMVKTRVNQIHGAYTIDLIGNATFTHQIWIDEDQLRQNNLEQVQIESTGEELHYQEFIRQLPRYRF